MFGFNKIDQQTIKISNRMRILRLIAEKREITKQEIADILKLSVPTVTTNINKLLNEGLVEEAGVAESTGGRKPVILCFRPNARYAFGIDISPRKITVALTNLYAEIVIERESKIKEEGANFADIISESHQMVEEIIRDQEIERNKILGVGFSLPGMVDEENLILENAPNLKVKNFDFKLYGKLFDMPIFIENEANAAAIGEKILGVAKDKNNLIFISITEGIGTGIIIQEHIYKSSNKKAGEFGHMRITDEDFKCNCGRTGCWELYASEKALIRQFNQSSKEEISSVIEFFNQLENGSTIAKEVLDKYLSKLAVGIQNIILALAPEYVIIGGKVSKYHQLYENILMSKLNAESSIYDIKGINIGFSSLDGNASLCGASLLAMQDLYVTSKQSI